MAHIAEGQCEHGPMSHVNGLHLWVRECNGPTRTSMTQIASVRSDRGARERGRVQWAAKSYTRVLGWVLGVGQWRSATHQSSHLCGGGGG